MTLRQLYPSRTPLNTSKQPRAYDYRPYSHEQELDQPHFSLKSKELGQKFSYLDANEWRNQPQTFRINQNDPDKQAPRDILGDRNFDAQLKFSFNKEWETNVSSNRQSQTHQNQGDVPAPSQAVHQREKQAFSRHNQSLCKGEQSGARCRNQADYETISRVEEGYPLRQVKDTVPNKRNMMAVGSIKRNRKANQMEDKVLNQEFIASEIDLEELENIRMSKLKEMNDKLNRVLNKENVPRLPQNVVPSTFYRDHNPTKIQSSTDHPRQDNQRRRTGDIATYLDSLFDLLDGNKTGMLSKNNCSVNGIQEELKFVFGSIFTKIFLKNLRCNKRQFTKLCLNAVKEIDESEIMDILEKCFPQNLENSSKCLQDTIKYQRKINEQERFLSNSILQGNDLEKDITQQTFCQNRTRRQYHEIDQPRVAAQIAKQMNLQPIEVRPYSISKDRKEMVRAPSHQQFQQNRRSGSVSESMILQHRRSLEELNELDVMMSKILNSKGLAQHRDGLSNSTLHFEELIKHI